MYFMYQDYCVVYIVNIGDIVYKTGADLLNLSLLLLLSMCG